MTQMRSLAMVCGSILLAGVVCMQSGSMAADPIAAQMAAPSGAGNEATTAIRKNFAEVSGWITKAADLVPAEKYSYKPTPTVRTYGQLLGHVVDGYNYFCPTASGKKVEWSDATEKGGTDKAALVAKLKQATEACNAAYASNTAKPGALIDNIGHANLHYGNIITYVRMMELKPPSS